MLCNACSKLVLMNHKRSCLRCKGIISNNLSVVCDNCSALERLCSICLKKLYDTSKSNKIKSNCGGCGGK